MVSLLLVLSLADWSRYRTLPFWSVQTSDSPNVKSPSVRLRSQASNPIPNCQIGLLNIKYYWGEIWSIPDRDSIFEVGRKLRWVIHDLTWQHFKGPKQDWFQIHDWISVIVENSHKNWASEGWSRCLNLTLFDKCQVECERSDGVPCSTLYLRVLAQDDSPSVRMYVGPGVTTDLERWHKILTGCLLSNVIKAYKNGEPCTLMNDKKNS